jgi:hypothetical protein
MDIKKAQRFNEKMGKVQKMSKGGMIKKIAGRHYFDDGGATTLGGPATSNGNQAAGATVNNNGVVGGIGNLLGLNNQFQAQSANIQGGTNSAQLNNAYTGAQSGLAQQQNLANQVQPGVSQGVGTQNALTGQLEGVVNGSGPNAAQTALNQNTATNVANQAALMASQRGASANAGLLARQAAQQGAATQQQAVGQAATTQAQQQIAAQEQLANLAQTQVGQGAAAVQGVNSAQQNEQNILQGANTAANNANVAMQSNINNVNAGISTANQQQAGNIVNGITGAIGSAIGLAKGGEVQHVCAGAHCTDRQHSMHMMASGGALDVGPGPAQVGVGPWLQSSVNTAGPSVDNSQPQKANIGNPFSKVEDEMNADDNSDDVNSSQSGEIANAGNNYATEANHFGAGATPGSASNLGASPLALPQMGASASSAAPSLLGSSAAPSLMAPAAAAPSLGAATQLAPLALAFARGGKICEGPHKSHVANFLASGGPVKAMLSPGERYLNPEEVKQVVEQGKNPLKAGMKVPGKPKVKGDSLKNDVVPADLEEGGVVIPRHIMNKKNRDHAELFVRRAVHLKAPKGGK